MLQMSCGGAAVRRVSAERAEQADNKKCSASGVCVGNRGYGWLLFRSQWSGNCCLNVLATTGKE